MCGFETHVDTCFTDCCPLVSTSENEPPSKNPASCVCSHVTPRFKGQRGVLCHLAHLSTLWSFQQVCQPMLILVQTCIFYLIPGVHITFVTCYSHDS